MKKINKAIIAYLIVMLCTINVAFAATAVPEKKDGSDDSKVTVTVKDNDEDDDEEATAKATKKATSKATEKSTSKATSTTKTTEKATSTAKAKSTSKATTKATSKASVKDDEDDDKVVLETSDEDDVLVVETTLEPTLNVQNNGAQLENSKYLTKGGAFLWFLFTVLVSAVISFAIAYRFYTMTKRDNHLTAELRALKRDIDSKMVGTVNGFSEYDMSVSNSNPSYSREGHPIRTNHSYQSDEKSEEIYKKWETQIQHTKDNDLAERAEVRRSSGQTSGSAGRPSYERRRPAKKKTGFVGKIKNTFNEMFPFDK